MSCPKPCTRPPGMTVPQSDRQTFKSLHGFHTDLKRFLHSDQGLALLETCLTPEWREMGGKDITWTEGGCRILADAIQPWLGEPAEIMMLGNDDAGHDCHLVVRCNGWFLDGDGVSTWRQLQLRYARWAGIYKARLYLYEPDLCEGHDVWGAPHTSRLITQALADRYDREEILGLLGVQNPV